MEDDPGIQSITRDIGLEVDGRGLQHQPYDRNAPLEDTEAHFQANFRPDERRVSTPHDHGQYTVSPKGSIQRRWRRIIVTRRLLWLSLALAMMSCLAITAAVLAIFFAKERRYVLGEPTSNCKELKSPYNSINGSSFNLHCGTNYLYSDLMTVWVYQFVDCIHACASFNANHRILNDSSESCTGVSYPYTLQYGTDDFDYEDGNCFLKAVYPIPYTIPGVPVDSAFYTDLGLPKY